MKCPYKINTFIVKTKYKTGKVVTDSTSEFGECEGEECPYYDELSETGVKCRRCMIIGVEE